MDPNAFTHYQTTAVTISIVALGGTLLSLCVSIVSLYYTRRNSVRIRQQVLETAIAKAGHYRRIFLENHPDKHNELQGRLEDLLDAHSELELAGQALRTAFGKRAKRPLENIAMLLNMTALVTTPNMQPVQSFGTVTVDSQHRVEQIEADLRKLMPR
jgi:hypothetical protein